MDLGLGAIRLDGPPPRIPSPPPAERPAPGPSSVVELPDGSVSITIGEDLSVVDDSAPQEQTHTSNLATLLADSILADIATTLLGEIQQDDASRQQWLADRAAAIEQLGFSRDTPQSPSSAPLQGMSTVRHPMLAEAVLRFQANARGELLPADGPVKVRLDDPFASTETDLRANNLQRGLNRYLTTTSPEYYPDTDRMLFWVGLGGCAFKKVHHCPIRRRPVSDSVDAKDLIVSNAAVDLASAPRITQRILMKPSTLRRMQIVGAYRTIEMATPAPIEQTAVDQAQQQISGVAPPSSIGPTSDYELYECYCELDIPGFHHEIDGAPSGLAVPYRVVIDRSSQTVLEIRRNWAEGDPLCMPREVFVKYPYVPCTGFYDIGLGQIMANTTTAATAGWREGLDAGMFANFPGFLYAKGMGRQNTLDFRIAPGAGVGLDTGGRPIGEAVMPLPYKEMGPSMSALIENIVETGRKLGGTAEMAVGEGKQEAPVGTTLALIEQAMKIQDAVHKRLHQAQSREFQLLVDLFREDPTAFFRNNRGVPKEWQHQDLLAALADYDIVPHADPNTAGAMQRVAKAQAVYMIAKDNPSAFDELAVYFYVLSAIGVGQPASLLAKGKKDANPAQADPMGQASLMAAQARMLDAQTKQQKLGLEAAKMQMEDENRDQDRALAERLVLLKAEMDAAVQGQKVHADAIMEKYRTLADTAIEEEHLRVQQEQAELDRENERVAQHQEQSSSE